MTEGKNVKISCNFDLRSQFIASTVMETKKLLADENKKQRVKQNKYVSWVLYVKFRIEKDRLVKYFAFLENVCYQYLNCVLRVTVIL